jgi:glyoxylase I family protein
MELKLHHVNYSTKDVGAVAEFYQSLFKMKPASGYEDAQITSQGYDRKVAFLTDGTTEFHIAPQDLGVAFRTKQSLNPLDRGHIAFRTDDIEAFKEMLREKNIQFADYGVWAIGGWYQIFLQDPDGTIVEVHRPITRSQVSRATSPITDRILRLELCDAHRLPWPRQYGSTNGG